jgi:hypothetical protein
MLMHKPKPYKCPSCGAEIPDLPMRVLEHQLSHVERLPYPALAGLTKPPAVSSPSVTIARAFEPMTALRLTSFAL